MCVCCVHHPQTPGRRRLPPGPGRSGAAVPPSPPGKRQTLQQEDTHVNTRRQLREPDFTFSEDAGNHQSMSLAKLL